MCNCRSRTVTRNATAVPKPRVVMQQVRPAAKSAATQIQTHRTIRPTITRAQRAAQPPGWFAQRGNVLVRP